MIRNTVNNFSQSRPKGFTLIEVLIALVILGIALPAIIKTTSDSIKSTSYLRDKTLAHWVALNTISRLQLGLPPTLAEDAEQKGTEVQFGKSYYWSAGIDNADDPYVLRIYAEVREKPDGRVLDRSIGFLQRQPSDNDKLQ